MRGAEIVASCYTAALLSPRAVCVRRRRLGPESNVCSHRETTKATCQEDKWVFRKEGTTQIALRKQEEVMAKNHLVKQGNCCTYSAICWTRFETKEA